MFGFDSKALLAGFANPVVFAFNERVVMDSFAVVGGAHIALHHGRNSIRFYFGSSFCEESLRITRSTRRFAARPSGVSFDATGQFSPYPAGDRRCGDTFASIK
jgi:hypothetical protein